MKSFSAFVRSCAGELRRVIWPSRPQTLQGVLVTLCVVVALGLYLGAADLLAARAVEVIF